MKKHRLRRRLTATLLALLAIMAALAFASCSSSSDDDDGSSEESVTYAGAYTIGDKSYSSLKLTGSESSGTAELSGSSGSLSGTYSSGSGGKALVLKAGNYTLVFGSKTVYAVVTLTGDMHSLTLYTDSGRTISCGTGGDFIIDKGTWISTSTHIYDDYDAPGFSFSFPDKKTDTWVTEYTVGDTTTTGKETSYQKIYDISLCPSSSEREEARATIEEDHANGKHSNWSGEWNSEGTIYTKTKPASELNPEESRPTDELQVYFTSFIEKQRNDPKNYDFTAKKTDDGYEVSWSYGHSYAQHEMRSWVKKN